MANTLQPFGLALAKTKTGHYTGIVKLCYIPSTNSNKLYVGDAVVLSGGSNSAEYLDNKAGSLPTIAKASTSGYLSGVIAGFLPDGDSYISGAFPASKEGAAWVILNPNATFNIAASGEVTAAMIGKYGNLSLSNAGNDYSGVSGMVLDVSTVDTTATKQLKIVDVAEYVTNSVGNYAVVEVELNVPTSVDLTGYLTSATAAETYQAKLTAGDFVDITGNTITTTYTAGSNIVISDEGAISYSAE